MIHSPTHSTINVEHFTYFYLLPRDSLHPAVVIDAESLTSPGPETLDVGLENNLRHDAEIIRLVHTAHIPLGRV